MSQETQDIEQEGKPLKCHLRVKHSVTTNSYSQTAVSLPKQLSRQSSSNRAGDSNGLVDSKSSNQAVLWGVSGLLDH